MRAIVAVFACLWTSATAAAQAVPATFSAGVEQRRLTYEYRFENDSSIGTEELVPHFFIQHYEADQTWLTLTASYPAAGGRGTTRVGYAPERLGFASDFDTFFQPDGDVVVTGTAGDARQRAFSIRQAFSKPPQGGWTLAIEGSYTNRRADYLPADRVVTHTQPASESREFITTREYTTSHEFEVGVSLDRAFTLSPRWQVLVRGAAWPVTRARLVTVLPDKYPGREIVFDAIAFGGGGSAELVGRRGRLRFAVLATANAAGPYRKSARYRRSELGIGVSIGLMGAARPNSVR